jgi:hypothetical protein
VLNKALAQEKDAEVRWDLADSLAAVADRLEPAETTRVCAEAVGVLIMALAETKDGEPRGRLASGLAAVAGRLEPAETARVCGDAARLLNQAFAQERDVNGQRQLATGLVAVAGRLEPAEAAGLLSQVLGQEKDRYARKELADGLAAVAVRLEPRAAAHVCGEAARSYIPVVNDRSRADARLDALERLSMLIQPLESDVARHAAEVLTRRIVSQPDAFDNGHVIYQFAYVQVLERCLTSRTRPQVQRRAAAVAAAVGTSAQGPAPGLPMLAAAGEPLPCRLSTQDLVELLKMPTCVGPVRRVVLDQLGNRYGRRFATHWEFGRYAQEQRLNLDFTTPPRRPDRKLPPLFEQ